MNSFTYIIDGGGGGGGGDDGSGDGGGGGGDGGGDGSDDGDTLLDIHYNSKSYSRTRVYIS